MSTITKYCSKRNTPCHLSDLPIEHANILRDVLEDWREKQAGVNTKDRFYKTLARFNRFTTTNILNDSMFLSSTRLKQIDDALKLAYEKLQEKERQVRGLVYTDPFNDYKSELRNVREQMLTLRDIYNTIFF